MEDENFSIGIFYLLLSDFNSSKINKQTNLKVAARLEIIFILADLLDDIFDKECLSPLSTEEHILNILALLFSSVNDISRLDHTIETNQIINCLNKSIKGELADFYSTIKSKTRPSTYFQKMTLKSTSLIELVTYVANPDNPVLWKQFASEIAIALQLRNDAQDIINLDKSDLRSFKETFPLIKAKEYAEQSGDMEFIDILHSQKMDNVSQSYLIDYIKSSGAIEVSIYLSSQYSKSAIKILEKTLLNNKNEITNLKEYLKI